MFDTTLWLNFKKRVTLGKMPVRTDKISALLYEKITNRIPLHHSPLINNYLYLTYDLKLMIYLTFQNICVKHISIPIT